MRVNPASTGFSDGLGAPKIYFLTHHSKSIERTPNSRSQCPFLLYRFPSASDFPSAFLNQAMPMR